MATILANYQIESSTRPSGPLSPLSPFSVQDFPDAHPSSLSTKARAAGLAVSLLSPMTNKSAISIHRGEATNPKTVHFSLLNNIQHTISRHDMSPEEHNDYWLQGHELCTMKRRYRRRVFESEYGDDEEDGEDYHNTIRSDDLPGDSIKESKSSDENLCIPDLGSGFTRNSRRSQSYKYNDPDYDSLLTASDDQYSSIYDCDTDDDPFAEVCFEVVGTC